MSELNKQEVMLVDTPEDSTLDVDIVSPIIVTGSDEAGHWIRVDVKDIPKLNVELSPAIYVLLLAILLFLALVFFGSVNNYSFASFGRESNACKLENARVTAEAESAKAQSLLNTETQKSMVAIQLGIGKMCSDAGGYPSYQNANVFCAMPTQPVAPKK